MKEKLMTLLYNVRCKLGQNESKAKERPEETNKRIEYGH